MNELTHLSLFSGIGGLDLAAEWAGFRTVGQCEWAEFPRKVLEKRWPGLPRWRDIRTLTKESFYETTGLESVTVLSGGFPCQPFITAGKRRGKEDDRYLWPEMLRVISEIRPCWVVGENVAGLVSMALDTVLSDLESIGYACQALIIPACAVDAPHRRDRCAIVGYSYGKRQQGIEQYRTYDQRWKTKPYRPAGKPSPILADAYCNGCARVGSQSPERCNGNPQCAFMSESGDVSNPDSQGFQVSGCESRIKTAKPKNRTAIRGWWATEPDVGRVAHGVPFRVDRLKCLGNAVVPQQFFPVFRAIAEMEETWNN